MRRMVGPELQRSATSTSWVNNRKNGIGDGFDIGGFTTNRVCAIEVEIKDYEMSLEIKVEST